MKNKKTTPKHSPEVRERAVRMVQEHRGEYSSLWAAIESIAPKIGCVGCCRSVSLVDSGDFEAGFRCVIGGAAPDNEELHGHAAAYVFSKMGVDVLVSTEF